MECLSNISEYIQFKDVKTFHIKTEVQNFSQQHRQKPDEKRVIRIKVSQPYEIESTPLRLFRFLAEDQRALRF